MTSDEVLLKCMAYNLWAYLQMRSPYEWNFTEIREALNLIEQKISEGKS